MAIVRTYLKVQGKRPKMLTIPEKEPITPAPPITSERCTVNATDHRVHYAVHGQRETVSLQPAQSTGFECQNTSHSKAPDCGPLIEFACMRRSRVCVAGNRCFRKRSCDRPHSTAFVPPRHLAALYGPFLETTAFHCILRRGLMPDALVKHMLERYKSSDRNVYRVDPVRVLDYIHDRHYILSLKDVARRGFTMRQMTSLEDYAFKVFANILQQPESDFTRAKSTDECCLDSVFMCFHARFTPTMQDRVLALRWIIRLIVSQCKNDIASPEQIAVRLERVILHENDGFQQTLSGVVSKLATLVELSNCGHAWASDAVSNFGTGVSVTAEVNSADTVVERDLEIMESTKDDAALSRLLDAFDEDRLLRASLNPPTRNLDKLLVYSYTVDIGKEYAGRLIQIWHELVVRKTNGGTNLPAKVSRDHYSDIMKPERATADNYTIPMHLHLLKAIPFTAIAQQLRLLQVGVFKSTSPASVEKQEARVKNWAFLAIKMVVEKNAVWRQWKVPNPADLLNTCDRQMAHWVSVCGALVLKVGAVKRADAADRASCHARWGEKVELVGDENWQSTDWRRLCRQLRDHEWNRADSRTTGSNFMKPALLLTYLYHASNGLKHTEFGSFDPLAFLHAAREVFSIYASRPEFDQIQVTGRGERCGFQQLNKEKSRALNQQFRGLVDEVWLELPASERFRNGDIALSARVCTMEAVEDELDAMGRNLEALTIK